MSERAVRASAKRLLANEGIAYVTVAGAGHMVPTFQPKAGFAMVERFLASQPY